MSEFEYFEAFVMSMELGALASMNFLAIFAMYLIAAYVAGRKLPRSVAVSTSVIYTMFIVPPFGGTVGNFSRAKDVIVQSRADYPESVLFPVPEHPFEAFLALFVIPMLLGWLGSLYFMHGYVRSTTCKEC